MGLLEQERLDALTERTRKGGGEIVRLLGKGSAFYAPAQAALEMAESVLLDQRRLLPCATLLNGEYGVDGLFVGVPTILDATGVRRVIELPLNEREHAAFARSVKSVRRTTREVERLLPPA